MMNTNLTRAQRKICQWLKETDESLVEERDWELLTKKHLWVFNIRTDVPEEISELKNLEALHLRGKDFYHGYDYIEDEEFCAFHLPKSIGELHNLTVLDIYNGLKALPEEIGLLTNLERLELMFSPVEVLPESIGDLSKLRYLKFFECPNLRSLPESIGKLKELKSLNVQYGSRLEALPDSICNLSKLRTLDINKAFLKNLPEHIGRLKSLEYINLDENELSSLPKSFKDLSQLETLNLGHNLFEACPEEVCQMKQLESLDLSYNPLKSFVKGEFSWDKLDCLDLENCGLTRIPKEVKSLIHCRQIKFGHLVERRGVCNENHFDEATRAEIIAFEEERKQWRIKKTAEIYPFLMQFEGYKKTSADEVYNIEFLDLDAQHLRELPKELVCFERLYSLKLDNNQLRTLPDEILELKELSSISITNNPIESLPNLAMLPELSSLKIDTKVFVEHIDMIKSISKLDTLSLEHSEGRMLPKELGLLRGLKYLTIQSKKKVQVPEELAKLINLDDLFFDEDTLTEEEFKKVCDLLPKTTIRGGLEQDRERCIYHPLP